MRGDIEELQPWLAGQEDAGEECGEVGGDVSVGVAGGWWQPLRLSCVTALPRLAQSSPVLAWPRPCLCLTGELINNTLIVTLHSL